MNIKKKLVRDGNLEKFFKVEKKVIQLDEENLVSIKNLDNNHPYPIVITPSVDNIDTNEWLLNNKGKIKDLLLKSGAILFRNFDFKTIESFQEFASIIGDYPMNYADQSSPRTLISDKLYTSTDHPADQIINLHCELSYSYDWPLQIMFYCHQPPTEGGETPIADSHMVYKNLSEVTKQKFLEKGVRYMRNLVPGIGLSWNEVYQTDDKSLVEKKCRENGIDYEWIADNHLRISWERHAIQSHPLSNLPLWFNHGYFFNARNINEDIRTHIASEFDYPFNTFYGSGENIEESVLDEIYEAYSKCTVSFKWEKGDILLLDNMRMAHGRNSFTGERKILVAMNDPHSKIQSEKV